MYTGFGLIIHGNALDEMKRLAQEKEGLDLFSLAGSYDNGFFFDEEYHDIAYQDISGKTHDNTGDIFILKAKRQPSPFEAAYSSQNELIAEFKAMKKDDPILQNTLTDDFDYASHIGTYKVKSTYNSI